MNLIKAALILTISGFSFLNCTASSNDSNSVQVIEDAFAKGSDVSWVTEMESKDIKFYNAAGTEMECMALLKNLGMNSIRLRVWVNPKDGWCNTQDLLLKAQRAKDLDMRIMIDFHYSDWWADPAKQTKPAAWADLNFEDLKKAVATHTTEVLTVLKSNNITPEWVQVGNETANGMLWDDGKTSLSMKNYAELSNAGYDAVKGIFPDAKVIVHLENGEDNNKFRWLFDGLKENGGKWDVIGMSLYPIAEWRETDEDWQTLNTNCLNNMQDMINRYGTEVIIAEVGLPWDQPQTAYEALTDIIAKTKSLPDNKGLGVFYWEPQSYGSWNRYPMGAFDNSGKPTIALDAFK